MRKYTRNDEKTAIGSLLDKCCVFFTLQSSRSNIMWIIKEYSVKYSVKYEINM